MFAVVSQQILDRQPYGLDRILIEEAAETYAAQVENELWVGNGLGSGQLPGL
jgi:hypothetical protein